MASITPPWPSLYNPSIEILHIEHHDPVQPDGAYLSRAKDVFLFTFYWSLIFYTPLFLFCGSYAFFNLTFRMRSYNPNNFSSDEQDELEIDQEQPTTTPFPSSPSSQRNQYTYIPLQFLHSPRSWSTSQNNNNNNNNPNSTPTTLTPNEQKRKKKNERRSRITYALLVLLIFLALGLAGAVVNSAILGFVTLGLYRAGRFHMSTWIPFLLGVLQVSVGLLSIWPSTIEII